MREMQFRRVWPERRLFERAIAILDKQPRVPMSPGCRDSDGAVLLCAGAALLAAGVEASGSGPARAAFERAIVGTGGETLFYRAIDALGWRGWIVAGAIRPNDACSDAERKPRMLSRLRDLADEVCGPAVSEDAA